MRMPVCVNARLCLCLCYQWVPCRCRVVPASVDKRVCGCVLRICMRSGTGKWELLGERLFEGVRRRKVESCGLCASWPLPSGGGVFVQSRRVLSPNGNRNTFLAADVGLGERDLRPKSNARHRCDLFKPVPARGAVAHARATKIFCASRNPTSPYKTRRVCQSGPTY